MRFWLATQYLIVIGYFLLTLFLWGPMAALALSFVTVPLIAFFRLELVAVRTCLVTQGDLQSLALFLLTLGGSLAVLPFVLSEIFESLFGVGHENLFWVIVVVVGNLFLITWCMRNFKSSFVRTGHEGVLRLYSSFVAVVYLMDILSRPIKFTGLLTLAMTLWFGFACGIGGLLVLFGVRSVEETFIAPNLSMEYSMTIGGFLLSLIPIFYLTFWWWSKEALTEALVGEKAR